MAEQSPSSGRIATLIGGAALGLATAILLGEKRRPLRRQTQDEPGRRAANLVLGAMSMATVAVVEAPMTRPLARAAAERRRGLAQWLPLPGWARDAAALLLMDYTIYLWHIATHKVPALWRLHLVHHIDLDMDATTALRFHAVDMAVSVPFRAAQVAVLGVSPRALKLWQAWFFLAVWFHHSNLALPARWERWLARIVTTPRMHGIHHSTVRDETASNWSSGFAIWDHLHGTFRLDVPQDAIVIGVPGYRDPDEGGVLPSLAMPFMHQRDAWALPPGGVPAKLPMRRSSPARMPQEIGS